MFGEFIWLGEGVMKEMFLIVMCDILLGLGDGFERELIVIF